MHSGLHVRSPVSILMVLSNQAVISETCCSGQERHLIWVKDFIKGFPSVRVYIVVLSCFGSLLTTILKHK